MVIDPAIESHYGTGYERTRLFPGGTPSLEFVRSLELLDRLLPAPPARVLDVGGGPGTYAAPLAQRGYQVHLVDPVALHVEQARKTAGREPATTFTATLGDARELPAADGSQDAVLLFGPLYHLTEGADRQRALAEAIRVLRPGGRLLAMAVCRYASLLDGLYAGWLDDPVFAPIVNRDLADGQHRNPDPVGLPSSSPPRSSTPRRVWPWRSSRPVSLTWRFTVWRGRAGRCARNGPTRGAARTSCSPRGRPRQSRRCSV